MCAVRVLNFNDGFSSSAAPTTEAGGTTVAYGSFSSPITVSAGVSLPVNSDFSQRIFVRGNGGPVDLSAVSPQIAAHTLDGAELWLIGTDNEKSVTLGDGLGVSQDGLFELKQYFSAKFVWINASSLWLCQWRSNL